MAMINLQLSYRDGIHDITSKDVPVRSATGGMVTEQLSGISGIVGSGSV
jgi:hypothetical protein